VAETEAPEQSPAQPSIEPEQAAQRARELLVGILDRMSIDADIEVVHQDDKIVLDIDCDDIDRIVGRRGQVIDALQHLLGKMVYGGRAGGRGKPIVVDAGGYRDRHVERLQQLAARMAEKAVQSGSEVDLSPMTPHDRRIVHLALAEMDGVTTRSEGEGDDRHIVVVPSAAPAAADAPTAE
jgi:spoIIIJ-associated protein